MIGGFAAQKKIIKKSSFEGHHHPKSLKGFKFCATQMLTVQKQFQLDVAEHRVEIQ